MFGCIRHTYNEMADGNEDTIHKKTDLCRHPRDRDIMRVDNFRYGSGGSDGSESRIARTISFESSRTVFELECRYIARPEKLADHAGSIQ